MNPWPKRVLWIAVFVGLLIIVFAHRLSQIPAIVTFETSSEWQEYEYPVSAFSGIDGTDLTGIVFSGPMVPGTFRLEIDDVELR